MKHTNNFDALRLGAALAVVLSHQFWLVSSWQPKPFGPMTLGSVAVYVFFLISGFLVASSWDADPKLWRFAARRFLRIWPAYAVVVVGTSLYVAATDSRPLAHTAAWMYVFKHAFFQPFDWDFFPRIHDARLNPPLWTIAFEIGCYVLFACAAAVFRKYWPAALALVLACVLGVFGFGMRSFDPSNVSGDLNWVWFGSFFAMGAIWSRFTVLRSVKACISTVGLGVLAYLSGSEMIGLALAIPALSIFIGTRCWPMVSRAGRFGDFSYGIYLWGWPVQWIVASALGVQVGIWTLLAVSVPAILVVAALSWHLVERRALAAKPGRPVHGHDGPLSNFGRLASHLAKRDGDLQSMV